MRSEEDLQSFILLKSGALTASKKNVAAVGAGWGGCNLFQELSEILKQAICFM